MLFYAVDRDKWEKDRGFLYICLIFRVFSVCSILADFESAGSAEHHVYDSDVSD